MNEISILDTICDCFERVLGEPEIFEAVFSENFQQGQLIDIGINGENISQLTALADHDDTMEALRSAIQDLPSTLTADITGAREITVVGSINGEVLTITFYQVVGGASQPQLRKEITRAALNIPVIYSYQNAPRPNLPVYAVVSIDSIIKYGWDEIREIDVNKIGNLGGQRRATIGVHYFGPNPMQEISKAYNSLEKRSILDVLLTNGIAVWDKNPIQNVTGMLETAFQDHAFFDFYIGFAENYKDDLGTIEQVELTGEYEGVNGEFVNGPDLITQEEIIINEE